MLRVFLVLSLLICLSYPARAGEGSEAAGDTAATPVSAEIRALQDMAARGDATEQFKLGDSYFNGAGVDQDYAQAAFWYQKAAMQGDAEAQAALANCYIFGRGIKADKAHAVKWFMKAAKQGNLTSQVWLANSYYHGWGVAQDNKEAYFWSLLATNAGDKTMIAVRDKAAGALAPADVQTIRQRVQDWEPVAPAPVK